MAPLPSDPLLGRQWYLHGNGLAQPAVHLNVLPVWADYAGRGVRIGVFDSLVEKTHADLAGGYDSGLEVEGLEYGLTGSAHGTEVAGVIAGRANGIGVVGVAHEARITSVPVIFSKSVALLWVEPAMAQAWRFDVVNMSYGGTVAFDATIDPLAWAPIAPHYATAAETGRGGLGTVMVVAAGNNRAGTADANLSYYQTDRHTLVVGAVNAAGVVSEYASSGANLLVVAPSSDGFGDPGVTTTDRSGLEGVNDGVLNDPVPLDYTTLFGGTSAASPMVAGVAALMLEANPALGWRDVREILALSARHTGTAVGVPASVRERTPWFVNGATWVNGGGLHVSANYGFGLVDARAAVRLAETWDAQQTSANEQIRTAQFTGPLVLNTANTSRELLLEIAPGVRAEQVTLALDIGGMLAQDLEIELISPRGTASMLFFHSGGPAPGGQPVAFRPWTFVSNAFFGEDAAGTWRLSLRDTYANGSTGTINGAVLSVFGDVAGPDDRYVFTDEFGAVAGMPTASVLADAGGEDTIDASAASAASVIDLRAGTAGQVAGVPLLVAPGILIEHAIGGDGHDRLTGNGAANHLRGGRGNDVLLGLGGDDTLEGGVGRDSLDGGAGRDVLRGGAGIDVLRGRGGDDTLEGGAGDDWLEGGAGADTLRGGAGLDALSYVGSPAGVSVALGVLGPGGRQAVSGGDAEGDLAYGFEHVVGSRHADTLAGDGRANHITGGGGGDTLSGGAGDDVFMFGPGDLLSATPVLILDFRPLAAPGAERDGISLRAIDAVAGGADDAFAFIGAASFTAPGQLRVWFDGVDTVIEGNTVGGVEPELRIRLVGVDLVAAGDFSL